MPQQKLLSLYRASAGSGKTYTLSVRYVALALQGTAAYQRRLPSAGRASTYRDILSVTFTNKAKGEMKERILQNLADLALWDGAAAGDAKDFADAIRPYLFADGAALPATEQNATLVEAAAEVLHTVLHGYDFFRVETIDVFFQRLLSTLAHELGLPTGYAIEMDDERIAGEAVDALMSGLRDGDKMCEWITKFARTRLEEKRAWNVHEMLKKFAEVLDKEDFREREKDLLPFLEDPQRVDAYRRALGEHLKAQMDELSRLAEEVKACVAEHGCTFADISDGGRLLTQLEKHIKPDTRELVKQEPELADTYKKYLADSLSLLRQNDRKKPHLCQMAEAVSERYAAFCRLRPTVLQAAKSFEAACKNLHMLPVLQSIRSEINRLNGEQNRVMLRDTTHLLAEMVDETDTPFVMERAGGMFRHVMIDEFQDTSLLQWKNFLRLVKEGLDSGHEQLLVGDIKQAIYRWRNGDWTILQHLEQQMPEYAKVLPLVKNYRSDRAIVEWNNWIFPRLAQFFDQQSPKYEGAVPTEIQDLYADVRQKCEHSEDEGYVEARIHEEPWDDDDRAAEVFDLLHELHDREGIAWEEILILVRNNYEGTKLMQACDALAAEEGKASAFVPFTSGESFVFRTSQSVFRLVQALRLVQNPYDTLAREYLAQNGEAEEVRSSELSGYQVMPSGSEDDKAPRQAQADNLLTSKLRTQNSFVETLLQRQGELKRLPLVEMCYEVQRLLPDAPQFGQEAAFMLAFMEHVRQFVQRESAPTLLAFLHHWDDKLAEQGIPAARQSGVRVMTIHTAKGLAAPYVIVPFADWSLRVKGQSLLWLRPEGEPWNQVPVLPVSASARLEQTCFVNDYRREMQRNFIDNINLLYVAFTRPRHGLFLFAEGKPNVPGTTAKQDEMNAGWALASVLVPAAEEGSDAPWIYEREEDDEGGIRHLFRSAEAFPAFQKKEPEAEKAEPADAKEKATPQNRLLLPVEPQEVAFSPEPSRMKFNPSRGAKEFFATPPALESREGAADGEEADAKAAGRKAFAAALRGSALHRVFSLIETEADVDRAIAEVEQRQGLPTDMTPADLREYVLRLLHTPDERVREWFSGTWQTFSECSILSSADREPGLAKYRPDRVLVQSESRRAVVIDYKTGFAYEEHADQVRGYMTLLQAMGYRSVQGFLWYLDHEQISEVFFVEPTPDASE